MNLNQTRRDLAAIPAMFDLLPLFAEPGVGVVSEGSSGKPGSKPPTNLTVLDLLDTREKRDADAQRTDYDIDRMAGNRRQGVLPTLASWVRLADGEMWDEGVEHEPPADDATVQTECVFLLANLAWIEDQRWCHELVDDVAGIARDLREATQQAPHQRLSCMDCGWDVEQMDDGAWFRCIGCGKTWGRLELHKMAERKKPRTLKDCAEFVGLSVSTLRAARASRAFKPVARDGKAELFDLQEVAAAVQHLKYRESA